ncbi:MAG: signal peptidase II [Ignavibacteriaceae bacterium]|nr:signal peptidase II [Ignavibacteriaceae bacterium]
MRVLLISLFVVIVDQFSKLFVKGFSIPFLNINIPGMSYGVRVPVIGDIFNITFVENPGIAFGIDFGADYKILISFFTLAASIGMLVYLYNIRNKSLMMRLSMAFIIGGAFGNLLDRMFYGLIYNYAPLMHGRVVDFFDLNFFNFYLFNKTFGSYIFNVADIAVTAGVILLLFAYKKAEAEELEPAEETLFNNCLAENKD